MRTFARRVAVVALTAGLVLILALPASAGNASRTAVKRPRPSWFV